MRLQNQSDSQLENRSNTSVETNQGSLVTSVERIQRAWRNYAYNKQNRGTEDLMAVEALNEPDLQQPMQLSTSPQSGDCLHLHSHHTVAGGLLLPTNARHLIEPDPNSFSSDYSEMAEPIREHLANVQIICREDLAMGNTVGPGAGLPLPSASAGVPSGLERGLDETDESYNRRVRVTNYLSLAQEFAALKKADSRALPFDLHRSSNLSKAECSSSSDEGDDDDDSDLDEADDGRSGNTATAESVSQSQVHSMEPKTYHPLPGRDGDQKSTSKCSNSKPCIPDVVASSNQSETNALPSGRCSITSALPSSAPQSSATASAQHRSGVVKCSGHDANDGSKTSSSDMTNKGNVVPETSVAEEFEVYTIETALPHVEWERLEQQFSKSSEEEKKRRSAYGGDRDEIRRRLAMSAFDDDDVPWSGGASRGRHGHQSSNSGTGTQNRLLHSATSLQVCYLNDAMDADREVDPVTYNRSTCKPDIIPKSISEASTLSQYQTKAGGKDSEVHEDFFAKQARLKAEAKLALAQVRPMAHMQLQVEKQVRKKSPLSEIVVGIPGFVDGKMRNLSRPLMQRMNLAQLQVVVNELHAQIEALNADLMQQLVDRDDLHMAQDSMLVDIDDLTRRAQEFAAKINKQSASAEISK